MEQTDRPNVDEALWVHLEGIRGRCFILGNPHTFRGRMSSWSDSLNSSYYFSKSQVIEASEKALGWIEGFLAGSEPEPEEMFGPAMIDAYDTDPRKRRWREAVADYRRTGGWPHIRWVHLIPFPPGTRLPASVWAPRGAQVWAWDGSRWVVADPQPPRVFDYLKGTICYENECHDVELVTTVHGVCRDCGRTTHNVPKGLTPGEFEEAQYTYIVRPILPEDESDWNG